MARNKCKGTTLRNEPCGNEAIMNGYCMLCFKRNCDMKEKSKQLDKIIGWKGK